MILVLSDRYNTSLTHTCNSQACTFHSVLNTGGLAVDARVCVRCGGIKGILHGLRVTPKVSGLDGEMSNYVWVWGHGFKLFKVIAKVLKTE